MLAEIFKHLSCTEEEAQLWAAGGVSEHGVSAGSHRHPGWVSRSGPALDWHQ